MQSLPHLQEYAATQGKLVVGTGTIPTGAAARAHDLTSLDEVVRLLARCLRESAGCWIPHPVEDLVHESHIRDISVTLARAGLPLHLGHQLKTLCPDHGTSALDAGIRQAILSVDRLHDAVLARAAQPRLHREIMAQLADAEAPIDYAPAPLSDLAGSHGPAPSLPRPGTARDAWRRSLLSLVRWLTSDCGLTQREAADRLNRLGLRTVTGRPWTQASISALLA